MRLRDLSLTGWLLALLLAFATSTVFVTGAWAVQSFHIGVFLVFAITIMRSRRGTWPDIVVLAVLGLLVLWGILQLLAHQTGAPSDTREAILHWGALAAVFLVARREGMDYSARHTFLGVFLAFSVLLGILCLLQLFTSEGRILWLIDSGHPEIFGTFPSHNNYAQFVELALPIALWQALAARETAWGYALAGGVLYASVIGSTSRAGAFLCSIEILLLLGLSFRHLRRSGVVLALVPAAALVFTLVVGWDRLWVRFQQQDPYVVRREYMETAFHMIRDRPLLGFGLGAFPKVADAYAIKDFPFYANHVHNDWLEFGADGGIIFALAVLYLFASRIPAMFRHPWALGLLAVMLHACVDYPFPRPAVSGWMFMLLGLLYASESE
ncbi:MAG TPA: O-antigen ligase family protein [Bryobacteraceae bacterium]|nr:O-antigen ligase family protein [Bryobacteraceae bacterium]